MKHLRDIDIWFAESVLPHEKNLLTLARKLLKSRDAARDLVQDVLAEVITDEKWRVIDNPKAYLMRMVYTRSISILRRRTVVPFQEMPKFETLGFAVDQPDALQIVSDRERMQIVASAINALPENRRRAFILCRVHGLSSREAAPHLGMTASGVRDVVSRTMAQLTKELGDLIWSHEPHLHILKNARQD